MKTPREILFQRHHAAKPRLDAVRRQALARLAASSQEAESWVAVRQILRSLRWHLAGWSAAWGLIALLNLVPPGPPAPTATRQSVTPPRQWLMAVRENRRQLSELLNSPERADPLLAAPALPPQRRSELKPLCAMA